MKCSDTDIYTYTYETVTERNHGLDRGIQRRSSSRDEARVG